MTGTLYDSSVTAADNDDALLPVGVDWREGQSAGSVNNTARALMAVTRAWLRTAFGAVATTGSANAYVYTSPGTFTLAAYVEGVRIAFLANFSNSGAATLNVDGLGAKAIRKNGTTALVTGDIVSGRHYEVVFDFGNDLFQLVGERSTGVFQPLDATLTALAALSTSADQYIRATGTDTFAMSSVTSAAQALLGDASVPRLSSTNTWSALTTFTAEITTIHLSANSPDIVITDTDGASDEKKWRYGISGSAGDFLIRTRTDADGAGATAVSIQRTGTTVDEIELNATTFDFNGALDLSGNALIGGTLSFAGNAIFTATSGLLSLTTGALQARLPRSSEASGTLTAASSNKVVVTTAGVTINDGVHAADDVIVIYNNSGSSVTITQDTGMTLRLHGTATTGNRTLVQRGVCNVYFLSASEAIVSGDVT